MLPYPRAVLLMASRAHEEPNPKCRSGYVSVRSFEGGRVNVLELLTEEACQFEVAAVIVSLLGELTR